MIPFNKPYLSGRETDYICQAVESGKISGNGMFTQKCHDFFQNKYGFKKCLLSTSCTDALEMAAILININDGDEVIMPSFTFVSTANAFVLRGARIVFADSGDDNPNMDVSAIEKLIGPKTRAIVAVHYAGVACDMDKIMELAAKNNLYVIEDAAQAIDSFYKGRPLGSMGHLAAFSFHETKNIVSGEGGMLVINDESLIKRAEIIWEKGTNRVAFWRGEVEKYNWLDIGSSFLPSEIIAAFLFAQLENLDTIQSKRKLIWQQYFDGLKSLENNGCIKLPVIPGNTAHNAHLFYIICKSTAQRDALIRFLKEKGVMAVFHYLCLHKSPYYLKMHDGGDLPMADSYSDNLLRLPLYFELKTGEVEYVIDTVRKFFQIK